MGVGLVRALPRIPRRPTNLSTCVTTPVSVAAETAARTGTVGMRPCD